MWRVLSIGFLLPCSVESYPDDDPDKDHDDNDQDDQDHDNQDKDHEDCKEHRGDPLRDAMQVMWSQLGRQ